MNTEYSAYNILMVQDSSPCLRTMKISEALTNKGFNVHLAHRSKKPLKNKAKLSIFKSVTRLSKFAFIAVNEVKKIIESENIDLVHYNNYPDKLGAKIISAGISVPFVYDQHDFYSGKRKLSPIRLKYERICNEKNDAAIYITENYRELVKAKYYLQSPYIEFPNFGVDSLLLNRTEFLPKKSSQDNNIHLVYVGLITQHKNLVRNMIDIFRELSERGFVIHVYSTRNKPYEKYREIPNVIIHKKLPITDLIREISQYDFGIAFLNNRQKKEIKNFEIKYGFWNKMNDYLMAAIPPITLDFYTDMSEFVKTKEMGISLESLSQLTPEYLISLDYDRIVENILANRADWTMDNQIDSIIGLYISTMERYNGKT